MNIMGMLLAVPILGRHPRQAWSARLEGEDSAHAFGHACSLWHYRSSENVMSPTCGGTKFKK